MRDPILLFGIVLILSTMSLEVVVSPFWSLGWIITPPLTDRRMTHTLHTRRRPQIVECPSGFGHFGFIKAYCLHGLQLRGYGILKTPSHLTRQTLRDNVPVTVPAL